MSYPQVVRVFATCQFADYDNPWQAHGPSRGTGSGVVIAGQRILTGAHVVAHATFLQVQKQSDPDKAVAHIVAICHDCDLALLAVDDPAFFADLEPAAIGELPELRDKVAVVGFPVGGEEISVTEGVVSRIEVQRYSHSQRYILAATVDAAINEGNSGGPVFRKGRVSGIAFQKLTGADNIGEMVPAPVIRTFLDGVDKNKDPRIPGLGIAVQNLENPLLRQRLGLGEGQSGVLVVAVDHGCSAWGVLQPGDAMMAIDGLNIANNGTVRYFDRVRTRYDVVLGHYYVGDSMPVTVMRDGKVLELSLTLEPLRHLVPRTEYDRDPDYFVYGGLVFQTLTRELLRTWDKWFNKAPKEFLHAYYMGHRTAERQQLIVLTQVLSDEINIGYDRFYNESVMAVNGVMPRDMAEFVRMLDEATGVVEIRSSGPGVMLFDSEQVEAANARILARYHITRDRSLHLLANAPGSPI
ncbi:S1C family serine protease [Haliangium ochraceum]|uniref:Peptidase S1 and S6 chymotrypsin/Hap n=1 Tax=Haliangium ochraceum (strain DSM 14365 / JCM 11303 / SMP-2) TaxID=502025 RepID=D0LT19_HALO1|nr:S1C family serine protease [Haliangium ochraceum]ACY19155.1 peptidase S1 and S6 chymotrypsin/Hap [Haliangium ochraceum DSM 14365]